MRYVFVCMEPSANVAVSFNREVEISRAAPFSMAVFSCLLASSEFLPARANSYASFPSSGRGKPDVDFYDTLVVDRLLMVVVERNGLGVIEHVLAVVVLLGGDGVIDDLEVAALAFDFVGDGFDVVPDAPHREMILVSSHS